MLKFKTHFAFFVLFFTTSTFSQALDKEQIALIQTTAASICDTVKEAKGSKTNTELQGMIEAELNGFAKNLARVGGSIKGKYTDETFTGLTRDATAAAIEGDRGCRERVFNKMFEKLDPPKDEKTAYKENGIRADLRKIQDYLRVAPVTESRVADTFVCSASDENFNTAEFRFEKDTLSITNQLNSSNERCQSGLRSRRETELICVAPLRDLDDQVENWNLKHYEIRCLTGKCFKCIEHSRWKNRDNGWADDNSEYTIGSASIYFGGENRAKADLNTFSEFGRAMARIISGGSDLGFCTKNQHMCE